MAPDAIIFGLANPTPEVLPEVAHRHARIVATGRSDYPNQINNVLAFPGIFRGAFEVHATAITEGMKLAAADALAGLVGDDLAEDLIIPSPFDPRVGRRSPRRSRRGPADGVAALTGGARSSGSAPSAEDMTRRATCCDRAPSRRPSLGSSHVRRLRRVLLPRRPAVRPGGGGAARPGGPRRLDDGRRSRRRRSTTTTSGRCAASGCARRRCR